MMVDSDEIEQDFIPLGYRLRRVSHNSFIQAFKVISKAHCNR